MTLIEGLRPSRGGPPETAEESYRPEDTLTEADKDMIDFLVDQAIEAWRRSR